MKVSIITVTYNSEATVKSCLTSVKNQTWPNIEHIIIDNASNDGTIGIIKDTPSRLTRLVSEPDKGIYDAINKGILCASGEIIGILNADDVFMNNQSVEKIVNAFKEQNTDCVYGNLVFTNQKGRVIRVWRSKPFISGLFEISWTPAHPTFYCKKLMYETYGLYKTDYKIAADVELMLRYITVHKINSYFLDDFLVNMRYGGISTRGLRSTIIITKEMRRAFKEHNIPFNLFGYLFHKFMKVKEFLNIKNKRLNNCI
jgi:glycosyltransferase involved in cell wall biosynthesis